MASLCAPRASPDAPGRQIGVFVIGMHRSGTSATARLVNLLGVPIGNNADLKPPSEANTKGYWEANSLTAFNDRLLRFLGGSWAAPPRLRPGWESARSLAGYRRQGQSLFRYVHETERWVWKDPRTCVTLPFWVRTLGAPTTVVLTHRNPLEIARSIPPRYEVSKCLALAIWERYMRTALTASRGLPVFVMPYSELVSHPRHWTERLRAFLEQRGIESPAAGAERAAAYIDPGLRRHALEGPSLIADPDLTLEQREIASRLESGIGEHDAFEGWRLPPESKDVESLLARRRQRDLVHWSNAVRRGPIDQRFGFAPTLPQRSREVA
jgi:hypothetical protein